MVSEQELLRSLEASLLHINEITEVSFDESALELNQIIFLVKYNIPVSLPNYYAVQRTLIQKILKTAKLYRLIKSEDRIEDYGEHFYFVFDCYMSDDVHRKSKSSDLKQKFLND